MATSVPNTARYGAMVSAILAAMADKQLTATTLAKKLGPKVPVPTVHGWLSYKNGPSDKYRKKLAKILGFDEAVLITSRAAMNKVYSREPIPYSYPQGAIKETKTLASEPSFSTTRSYGASLRERSPKPDEYAHTYTSEEMGYVKEPLKKWKL